MNEIVRAIYKAEFPKLKVRINKFKHKETGKLRFCVMQVNQHHYIYNASEWEMLEEYDIEGTERIEECLHNDMLKQMEEMKPNGS